MRAYRWLRFILIPFAILAMGFSAFMVIRTVTEYQKGDAVYLSISEQYVLSPKTSSPHATVGASETEPGFESVPTVPSDHPEGPAMTPSDTDPQPAETTLPTEIPSTPLPETAPIGVDFEGLKRMNKECIGWIYIPDTVVSYPVMQANNNSRYLDILPDGTANKEGSIFMDCRNDPGLSDRNTILYGHNMNNGSMFAVLSKYRRSSFFNAHRTIYYLTPDGDYKITVFACLTVSATGEAYDMFQRAEDLRAYIRSALPKANASAGIDVDRVERIFTLSTCTGSFESRTVLLGLMERLS